MNRALTNVNVFTSSLMKKKKIKNAQIIDQEKSFSKKIGAENVNLWHFVGFLGLFVQNLEGALKAPTQGLRSWILTRGLEG